MSYLDNLVEMNGVEYSPAYLNEIQISLEHKYDNRHMRKYVRDYIEEWEGTDKALLNKLQEDFPNDYKQCLDILSLLMIRINKTSVNAIVEMLINKDLIKPEDSVPEIIDNILKLFDIGLVNLELDSKDRLYATSKIQLTDEQIDKLDTLQYKLPMIVKPLITNLKGNNKGSGYLIKGSDSLILNNYHTEDIDSTVLDRFNSIPFTINIDLMKTIRNSWKCMKQSSIDIEEDSNIHPDTIDNFNRYEKGVFKSSAILINHGNKFYLTHKYDKRGRIYSCGYHINYQSNSYAKAQLEFANKELITDEVNFFE